MEGIEEEMTGAPVRGALAMDAIRKLVGERCYLSPCMDGDAEEWTRWLNELEVAIPLEDEAYTQPTLADQEELARGVKENAYHLFTIVALEDDRRIGRCGLFGVDHANRRASLGISIGERSDRGRGLGQDACRLLLDSTTGPTS